MYAPELVHRGPEMRAMLGLCIFGFFFMTLSFWSDNWWYSFNPKNTFQRCGPWIFCFNGYVYPRDYRGKYYYGCWYIYVKEFRWLLDLLLPPWFIAFQVFETIACICNFVALMIVAFTYWRPYSITSCYARMQRAFVFKAAETISHVIAISIFGDGATSDWQWMPLRMDNLLGWGFGLAIISNMAALACLVPLAAYGWRLRERIRMFTHGDDDDFDTFKGVKVSMAGKPATESRPLHTINDEIEVNSEDEDD